MRKIFWYRVLIGACAFVIISVACFSPLMASASYVGDHSTNAQELEQIRVLYEAASRCLGSSARESATISLSSRSDYNSQYMKDFYNLNSGKLFAAKGGSGNSNLVYSATLEVQTSGGYKDGKIYCSELNLIPELLNKLGQYTTSTRNTLICNGSQPGLFTVTTGYGGQMFGAKYDNDGDGNKDWPSGWPDQNDCSGNLALLIDYIENRPNETILGSGNGNHDYPFNVKIAPSANAASYFQTVVGPMVGRFDELDSDTRKTMDYWRYYQAFESGCGVRVNNGNTNPPAASSNNMNALYDAVTKTVYYHSDSDINASRKVYYNVTTTSQLTCKELATKLGEDASKIALETQHADVQDCINRYKESLDQLEDQIKKYNSVQNYASGLKDYLNDKLTKIRNGKFEPSQTSYGAPDYYDIQNSVQVTAKNYYRDKIHAGVDGKIIYNDELLNTIVNAFEDIANNITMSSNKIDIETKPNDETLKNFEKLLEKWQTELDRVESEINSAQNLLDEKRPLVGGGEDKSRGEVWDFDESSLMVTCPGLDKLDEEIAKILSAAPPNINTNWSGAVVERPDYNYAGSGDQDPCDGAAGSLGWILCPVLRMVSEGVDNIYNDYVQGQFLEVNANNLNPDLTDAGRKVYSAWGTIRNIANVLFVILFMIVMISQLTGFGLTNYGIKKMLPKLIIVAVLVNISFLLCQFAVDISNVLGYSLNSMFDGLGDAVNGTNIFANNPGNGAAMGWVELFGLIGAGLTAGSWLPSFLLVLLSSAISVFFGAIILAARQAGIYILIILAPAAIVCYALPNSKKLFDRWFKIFISLLLVFPITGALMGGGNFASSLLLGTGGFFMSLVAMLLRVVPFFLIPGLVRSSMAGLGNLGAKISNMGNRLGGTATSGIRKSDGFQRFSEFGEQLRGRGIQARHKLLDKIGAGALITKGSKRRLARAIGLQEARIRGDAKANAIAAGGFISSGRRDDIGSSAIDAEETQGIKDAENGYRLNEQFDVNSESRVSKELEERLNDLQKNPDNIEVRRKVKALTKILLETDNGRGALAETVQKFAEAHPKDEATKILGKYLGNGENMGKIKGSDQRGLQKLVMDINKGDPIRSMLEYGALGTDKLRAGAVGNIDVSALKQQVAAAQGGKLAGETLTQVADVYRQALASENAANLINGESLAEINKLFKEEYKSLHGGSDDGFQAARLGASSTDSGRIQVQGSSEASGGLLLTGNDAREAFDDAREMQRRRDAEQRDRQRPIN